MISVRFAAEQVAGVAELGHRDMEDADVPAIAGFARSPTELFHMWYGARWPFSAEQMWELLPLRVAPTTFTLGGTPVGFAALASYKPGISCGLGSVVVNPAHRGHGVGRYLVRTMVDKALLEHRLPAMDVYCYADNTRGLLLYAGAGLRPWKVEERAAPSGERIALVIFRVTREEWIARRTMA